MPCQISESSYGPIANWSNFISFLFDRRLKPGSVNISSLLKGTIRSLDPEELGLCCTTPTASSNWKPPYFDTPDWTRWSTKIPLLVTSEGDNEIEYCRELSSSDGGAWGDSDEASRHEME